MKKKFNRNPKGFNQWKLRSDEEIQKIINKHPSFWTKKDFRGEGKNNSKKILSKTETQRPGLKFGKTGRSKIPIKDVYKFSTDSSIMEFKMKTISEETFRERARVKKQRDLMSPKEKQLKNKIRYINLTDEQKEAKRQSNIKYRKKKIKY